MNSPLDQLDPEQRACAGAPAGPLVIEAGPGSGKTRVLAARLAHRVQTGSADAQRCLVLTFTRQAATELQVRLARFGVEGARACTVHSLAFELVERYRADRRQPRRRVGPISRRLVQQAIANMPEIPVEVAVRELDWIAARGLSRAHGGRPLDVADIADALATSGRAGSLEPHTLAEVHGRYHEVKRARGVFDLGDLLIEAAAALSDVSFGAAVRWRFAHVFLDEAQDLNPAQWAVVRAVADNDLCLIGDADQAIYGWNGADASFLTQFEVHFPDATRHRLVRNYRCPPTLAAGAARVLGRAPAPHADSRCANANGHPDPVVDRALPVFDCIQAQNERQEALMVARRLRQAMDEGIGVGHLAVLARTNDALQEVEQALREEGIPFRSGQSFLDRPLVREALNRLEQAGPALSASGGPTELRGIIEELEQEASKEGLGSPADGIGESRQGNLDPGSAEGLHQLLGMVKEWSACCPFARVRDLGDWLAATVRSRGGDPAPQLPAVVLSTFHRAKGLQWRRVFIVGFEAGLVPLPSPADQSEERRLLYVALTRAEESVLCTWVKARRSRGQLEPRAVSPYLKELCLENGAEGPTMFENGPIDPEVTKRHFEHLRSQLATARASARHRAFVVPEGTQAAR